MIHTQIEPPYLQHWAVSGQPVCLSIGSASQQGSSTIGYHFQPTHLSANDIGSIRKRPIAIRHICRSSRHTGGQTGPMYPPGNGLLYAQKTNGGRQHRHGWYLYLNKIRSASSLLHN